MANNERNYLERSDANLIEVLHSSGLEEKEIVDELVEEGHTENSAEYAVSVWYKLAGISQ